MALSKAPADPKAKKAQEEKQAAQEAAENALKDAESHSTAEVRRFDNLIHGSMLIIPAAEDGAHAPLRVVQEEHDDVC